MGSVNKVILLGRVGKSPDIRSMQSGKEVASFSLATSEKWRDKSTGEQKENTQWHNVVIFSEGLVKIVKQYVKKGSQLYIEGSLKTRKWTKDGRDNYITEIVLQGFGGVLQILDSKSDVRENRTTEKAPSQSKYGDDIPNDEIPF